MDPVRLPWRKLFSHLLVVINRRLLLGQQWGIVSISSSLEPVYLRLVKALACSHTFCEVMCASFLLCLQDLVSLPFLSSWALTIFLPARPQSSLYPEGKDLMETCNLGLSVPRPVTLHSVQLWVSVFVPMYYRRQCL